MIRPGINCRNSLGIKTELKKTKSTEIKGSVRKVNKPLTIHDDPTMGKRLASHGYPELLSGDSNVFPPLKQKEKRTGTGRNRQIQEEVEYISGRWNNEGGSIIQLVSNPVMSKCMTELGACAWTSKILQRNVPRCYPLPGGNRTGRSESRLWVLFQLFLGRIQGTIHPD
ncbi:hypothetical protein Tco_0357496 [Tanacetum coccineum]